MSVLRGIGLAMLLCGFGALLAFDLISAFILFVLGSVIMSVVPE